MSEAVFVNVYIENLKNYHNKEMYKQIKVQNYYLK